jgi:hypothetical protein
VALRAVCLPGLCGVACYLLTSPDVIDDLTGGGDGGCWCLQSPPQCHQRFQWLCQTK